MEDFIFSLHILGLVVVFVGIILADRMGFFVVQ